MKRTSAITEKGSQEKGILERFDRTQDLRARLNADFSDEEIARDVAEARRERPL